MTKSKLPKFRSKRLGMKKALILHAWFATPNDHWYPWLKKELEKKEYNVFIPQLKDKDKPTLKIGSDTL